MRQYLRPEFWVCFVSDVHQSPHSVQFYFLIRVQDQLGQQLYGSLLLQQNILRQSMGVKQWEDQEFGPENYYFYTNLGYIQDSGLYK